MTRFDESPVVASAPIAVAPAAPERLNIETIVTAPAENTQSSSTQSSSAQANAALSVFLQLGAFSTQDSAEVARDRMIRQLDDMKIDGVKDPVRVVRDAGLFKIHFGPFANADAAATSAERIRQQTQFKPFAVQRPAS